MTNEGLGDEWTRFDMPALFSVCKRSCRVKNQREQDNGGKG